MKQKPLIHTRLIAALAGLALAGFTGSAQAASTIANDFNGGESSINDFSINFGTGSVAWDSSAGVDASGCLKVTLDASNATNHEVAPMWTIPGGPIDTGDYMTLDYDIMVDPGSGLDSSATPNYGNYQEVWSDASWSWDNNYIGDISAYGGVWQHRTVSVPNNAKKYYRSLFVLQGTAPYSANVVVYIDNIVLTVQANPYVLDAGTEDTSTSWNGEGWTGITTTTSHSTAEDAGGGHTPLGCLVLDNAFGNTWQQAWIMRVFPTFNPSRWSYIECDVKVDAALSVDDGSGNYGSFNFDVREANYTDHILTGNPVLDSSYTSWKHVKLPLPGTGNAGPLDIMLTGTHGGRTVVYVDNLTLTKPITPPSILALQRGTSRGVYITVDPGTDNQYDEEGISNPSADNASDFFWINETPATYSISLADFPSPAKAPGFDAHIYLINGDSLDAGSANFTWNSTYSGALYNAYDSAALRIRNSADNNGVVAIFEWKTNLPSANAPAANVQTFALPQYASANGTWSLTFSDNTHASLKGPDGLVATNFTIPDIATDPTYANNFTPATSCIMFGLAKNDFGNTGVNNGQSATISTVKVQTPIIDRTDDFSGGSLTASNAWRTCTYWKNVETRAFYRPGGISWYVEYGEPSTGYSVESSANLSAWGSGGVTYTYTDGSGIHHWAAVPTASLPAADKSFFRLKK